MYFLGFLFYDKAPLTSAFTVKHKGIKCHTDGTKVTSSIWMPPVLSFSALTPTRPPSRPHPRSSTLPWTPVSPALSALGGICMSNRANSHTTIQSASHSHLPLVSEWSLLRAHRPSFSSSRSLSKIQLQSKNMTAKNLSCYILIY